MTGLEFEDFCKKYHLEINLDKLDFNTMTIESYATNIESKLIKPVHYYKVKELDKETYLEQCEINNSLKLYLKESEKLKKIAEDFV